MKKFNEFISTNIYLARPYRWINTFLIGYSAAIFAGQTNLTALLVAGLLTLLLDVVGLCLCAEFMHKDRSALPNKYFILVLSLVALVIAASRLESLAFILVFSIFAYLYDLKKTVSLGKYSFLFRIFTTFALFFSAYFLYSDKFTSEAIVFALVVSLLVSVRNLVGDLRDVKFDRTTFPVAYGVNLSKAICIAMLFVATVSCAYLGFFAGIPAIVLFILLIVLMKNNLLLHRIGMLLSTVFLATYLFISSSNYLFFILMPLDVFANLLFYQKIYRPVSKMN